LRDCFSSQYVEEIYTLYEIVGLPFKFTLNRSTIL
jgi:hypothetical protein